MNYQQELYEVALRMLDEGISVFPVNGTSKKPTIKWLEYQSRIATKEELDGWYRDGKLQGLARATGKISNCVVVDCDSEEAHNNMRKHCPEILATPTILTPRGGYQYYFEYTDGLVNKAGYYPNLDIRTNGGYANIPPTANGNGKNYEFLLFNSFDDVKPMAFPDSLKRYLLDSPKYKITPENKSFKINLSLDEGNRNEALFHAAMMMIRGNSYEDEMFFYLRFMADHTEGPAIKDADISASIQQAIKRNRVTSELPVLFDNYLECVEGIFKLSTVYSDLGIKAPEDKHLLKNLILRRKNVGLIESVGKYDGGYRKVDNSLEYNDWRSAYHGPDSLFNFPLNINELVKVYNGDLVVVGGEPNAGKTAFILNLIKNNLSRNIYYFNSSETGPATFNERINHLSGYSPSDWERVYHLDRFENFHDVIVPGEGNVNIIDYLELYDDFYGIAGQLAKIHQKLKGAIAIVAVQKNSNSTLPIGGMFALQKPTLCLAISATPEHFTCEILKGKTWSTKINPLFKQIDYHIIDGVNICGLSLWHDRPTKK